MLKKLFVFSLLCALSVGAAPLSITVESTNRLVSPTNLTFNGIALTNAAASRALVTDSFRRVTNSAVTTTELNYLSGATNNLQSQINNLIGGSITVNPYQMAEDLAPIQDLFGPVTPQDIIIDTDVGLDPDDVSDLTIAANLHKQGQLRILAVMAAQQGTVGYMAGAIEKINRYNGLPNILIGACKSGPVFTDGWAVNFESVYYNSVHLNANVPDATTLYRKILAARPDNSVNIIFLGPLRNLYNLWNSTGDGYSALNGHQLITNKVKRLVLVAGTWPTSGGGAEYNMGADPTASQILNSITTATPVTFIGIEAGDPLIIPKGNGVNNGKFADFSPLRNAHLASGFTNRPSWGGLGLLYAARGTTWRTTNYFTTVKGRPTINVIGGNSWTTDASYSTEYIVKAQADSFYIDMLDELVSLADVTPLARRGDELSLSQNSQITSLTWGDYGTGFARSPNAEEVDFKVNFTNAFRLYNGGMVIDSRIKRAGQYPGYWFSPVTGLGTPQDLGIVRDPVSGLRVANDVAGTGARLTASQVFTASGATNSPAVSFGVTTGDTTTGFYSSTPGQWDFVSGGFPTFTLANSGAMSYSRPLLFDTTMFGIWFGTGSPNGGSFNATRGIYIDKAGSSGTTLYVKEAGTASNGGWVAVNPSGGGGSGDVVGPASSVDNEIALFSGTTGKLLKRASNTGIPLLSSGQLGTAVDGVHYIAPGSAGSISALTTGRIPVATSANVLGNSAMSSSGTNASVIGSFTGNNGVFTNGISAAGLATVGATNAAITGTLTVNNVIATNDVETIFVTGFSNGGAALPGAVITGTYPVSGNWTITKAIIIARPSGSIVMDVWKVNAALPSVANTITASAKPTLSSGTYAADSTLTGWTKTVSDGDVFSAYIEATPTTVTNVTLVLKGIRR